MAASDLKVETRMGVKRKSQRILSIVSNTTQLKGFPVGFFAEEMTRAFLMFTEAGHRVAPTPTISSASASFIM